MKREQRGFFANVKSISTVLSKKHILRDTFKISRTEGQNQKCEERKLKLVLSLTEAQEKGKKWKQTHRERGLISWKEYESVGARFTL